ncbi:protease inhibitor I42 family protein [Nocardia sp. NPDC048505]|uniref:protease inhibitor I42 family protein n=1 Tax=unclassified Nocardia TaxID=2637762 RepID=UPI0033EE2F96
MRKSLVVLLLGLTVAACGTEEPAARTVEPDTSARTVTQQTTPPEGTMTVTEADNGQERTLKAGQRVALRLPSNPSTGYGWQVVEVDDNVVEQVGDREYVSDQPVMPGTPGTEVWTFAGRAAGVTQLRMEYKRPWEQGVEPAKTFSLVLVVV